MDRKTIGRYEIIDELGRGAMGSVLRARDPAVGRIVALKCILSGALAGDQTNEFRERFYREARAAGALAHPGIVPVFDVGEDDGVPFLVMELVQGRTLADALKQGERYSLERVCEIGQGIAEALGYAHRNGIVHRDIKPANVLMTSREVYGSERPRITDFGVAKLAGGEITTTGQLLGTPAFMPPEQFTGAPIDGRTDLFSLGVILYRMATGEQPFSGETITAVSYKIVHTDPIPPSRLNPAIGARLEAVLLKCLAKNPMGRYQTGEELAADLSAVRSGAQAPSFAPPLGQETLGGFDPGQTLDSGSGHRPRTFMGQAPQWTVPPVNPTMGPPPPGVPPPAWPSPVPGSSAPMRTGGASPMGTIGAPSPAPRTAPASPAATMTSQPEHSRVITVSARTVALEDEPDEKTNPAMRSGKMVRQRKKSAPVLTWLIGGMIAIGASWYLLQGRVQQMLQQAADSSQAVAPPEPVAGAAPPTTAANFNPQSLDLARCGHLQLGFDSFPSAILLSVELDGQEYWRGVAGQSDGRDLVIPAGRHEVRVIAYGVGAATTFSNRASGDYSPSHRLLLMVQLHPEPPSGVATLPPGTRISLTVGPER